MNDASGGINCRLRFGYDLLLLGNNRFLDNDGTLGSDWTFGNDGTLAGDRHFCDYWRGYWRGNWCFNYSRLLYGNRLSNDNRLLYGHWHFNCSGLLGKRCDCWRLHCRRGCCRRRK